MKTSNQIDAENISKILAIPFDRIKTLDSLNRHYYRNIKAFNLLLELDPEVWKKLIAEMKTIKENLNK
tara:strand:+ start:431 stop:634 length:204 start_codon:yes stop_codon:yes gene_type:complete